MDRQLLKDSIESKLYDLSKELIIFIYLSVLNERVVTVSSILSTSAVEQLELMQQFNSVYKNSQLMFQE